MVLSTSVCTYVRASQEWNLHSELEASGEGWLAAFSQAHLTILGDGRLEGGRNEKLIAAEPIDDIGLCRRLSRVMCIFSNLGEISKGLNCKISGFMFLWIDHCSM